jgi:hypothetical protein
MDRGAGPRRNLKRAELRSLLLGAGRELLLADGLPCGIDQITLARVFAHVQETSGRRVTAASVYDRLWASQLDYQWDVLATTIEGASPIDHQTSARLRAVVRAADLTTEAGRAAGFVDLARAVVDEHVRAVESDARSRLIAAVMTAVASSHPDGDADPPHVARVRRALSSYLQVQADFYVDVFLDLGFLLGYRMRGDVDLRQLVLAVHAAGDGIAARSAFIDGYHDSVVPAADHSTTVASLVVESIALGMAEPDPDWNELRLVDAQRRI